MYTRFIAALTLAAVCGTGVWAAVPDAKSAQKAQRAARKVPAQPKPVSQIEVVMPLSAEQLAAAKSVHVGKLPCDLGVHVSVAANDKQQGGFIVESGKQRYLMEPVVTTTGAIRLEDRKAEAVWLQLANKSMLMDQKKGVRLADGCANTEQMVAARALETSKAPGLLDDPVAAPVGVATK